MNNLNFGSTGQGTETGPSVIGEAIELGRGSLLDRLQEAMPSDFQGMSRQTGLPDRTLGQVTRSNVSGGTREPAVGRREVPPHVERSERYNVRLHMDRAKGLSIQLVEAARARDFVEMGISATGVIEHLAAAWKHRGARDKYWKQVHTHVHGCLKSNDLDVLTESQARAVDACIGLLCGSVLDRGDVQKAIAELREVGLDPWSAVSGPTSE